MRDKHGDQSNSKPTGQDSRPSLFRFLLNSELPESELSVKRLSQEAKILLGAGTTTTAHALESITYYVSVNQPVRNRLSSELKDVMARYPRELPSISELEKLPYLNAVIKEGLRYGFCVLERISRLI